MRVLMLSHTKNYWTSLYARPFIERGDAVLVLSFSPEPLHGVDVEYIGIDPWDQNKHAYITRVPLIRKRIRQFRPDVVLAFYVASNGLAAVLSWPGPTVVSVLGGDLLEQAGRTGFQRWLRLRMVLYVCHRAAVIHTVSQEMDEELVRQGIPTSKIVQIPVGVDIRRFGPAPDMPRSLATRLICVRKHEPIYDNMTVVEALARLKAAGREFRCVMTSDGMLLDALKARARELGLEDWMTYTGELPRDRLPELFRQQDIYISASLSDGTSSALLEGMASGLFPVVSRITANLPWIEHEKTGLFFEPRRADELAKMLVRAMDDDELRRRAFDANRRRVEQDGDIRRNMERYVEIVDRVVAEAGRNSGRG